MTGADLVQQARRHLGVPFVHGARSPLGVDCVGLILLSAHEIGLTSFVPPGYSPLIDPLELERYLLRFCDRVDSDAPLWPGDVLLFAVDGQPIHLGLYAGESRFLHAFEKVGRVVEVPLDPFWAQRCAAAFRWRGLADG